MTKRTIKRLSHKPGRLSGKMGRVSEKTRQNLIELFYEEPSAKLTVRQIAARTKISRSTAQRYLQVLRGQMVISAENQWIDSWQNKMKKSYYYIEKIAKSGLVDYLEKELAASAIILFGSFRKGESVKGSDIDIFVEGAREKKLDLRSFEKELGHPIQLFVKPKITALPPHLLNNVVNGIKLKGYFTIK